MALSIMPELPTSQNSKWIHLGVTFYLLTCFSRRNEILLVFHKSNGKVRGWCGTTIIMVRWTEGGKSHEFQHCKCRHSGIGEKETQTQSVVGTKRELNVD